MLRIPGRAAVAAGTIAIGAIASTFTAPASEAQGWNIVAGSANCAGWYMCVYFSPNKQGAVWADQGTAHRDLADQYFSNVGAGHGQTIKNNSASMIDGTANCGMTTWYHVGYTGDFNWLTAGTWGNLNSRLRNNNASIALDNCR